MLSHVFALKSRTISNTEIFRLDFCFLWAWFRFFFFKVSEEAKREDVVEKIWKAWNDLGSLGKEPNRIGDWKRGLLWNFWKATQRWFGFLFLCLFYCFLSLPSTGKLGPHSLVKHFPTKLSPQPHCYLFTLKQDLTSCPGWLTLELFCPSL